MAKVKAVKWAMGGDEPDDLAEFLSNEDIVKKTKGDVLSKGTRTFAVKRLAVKPNRNGDDRISVMLVMKNEKGDNDEYNGYLCWDGFNVTDQGLPYIKRFIKALGLEWKDFRDKSKQDDQDPPHIVQIGKVKFESGKDPLVRAVVKVMPADEYNDDEHLEIARYLPAEGMDDDKGDDGDEGGATFGTDAGSGNDDGATKVDGKAEKKLRKALKSMDDDDLRKRAISGGAKKKDVKGVEGKALIDMIVAQELPPF